MIGPSCQDAVDRSDTEPLISLGEGSKEDQISKAARGPASVPEIKPSRRNSAGWDNFTWGQRWVGPEMVAKVGMVGSGWIAMERESVRNVARPRVACRKARSYVNVSGSRDLGGRSEGLLVLSPLLSSSFFSSSFSFLISHYPHGSDLSHIYSPKDNRIQDAVPLSPWRRYQR